MDILQCYEFIRQGTHVCTYSDTLYRERLKSRTPIVIYYVVSVLQCDREYSLSTRIIYSFHSARKMTK